MSTQPNILQITPFMYADDLEEAVRFFCDLLGFHPVVHVPGYAYLERENAAVRIMQNTPECTVPRPPGRPFRYYMDVRDLDAIYAELKPKLDQLPPDHVYGPVSQPYHQRELMILAPDGGVVVFGQPIRPPQA